MDSIRFGRALGMGARGAAKAVLAAADAAAAPKPASTPIPAVPDAAPSASSRAGRTVGQLRETQAGVVRGSRRFGEAVWSPFIRLGGVLWLELTGVFFGLFVIFAGTNAWKLRGFLHKTAANHAEHQHLLWSLAMTAVFAYFCVSSFLRANRRDRNR